MWRGFWGLGFALLSPLSLTLNTDKKLQKITSRRGLAQEAEHVRKKRERARKKKPKNQEEIQLNQFMSVRCGQGEGWSCCKKVLKSVQAAEAEAAAVTAAHPTHNPGHGSGTVCRHITCDMYVVCRRLNSQPPLFTPCSTTVCHLKLHVICLKAIQLYEYGVSNSLTVSRCRLCCGSSTCI